MSCISRSCKYSHVYPTVESRILWWFLDGSECILGTQIPVFLAHHLTGAGQVGMCMQRGSSSNYIEKFLLHIMSSNPSWWQLLWTCLCKYCRCWNRAVKRTFDCKHRLRYSVERALQNLVEFVKFSGFWKNASNSKGWSMRSRISA